MQVYDANLFLDGTTVIRCALKVQKNVLGCGLRREAVATSLAHRAAPGGLHPHIAEIKALLATHDRGPGPDGPVNVRRVHAIAMQLYPRDLRHHLKTELITLKDGFRMLRQIADALCCAKTAGVSHGDLKDDNVLLKDNLRDVVTSDFGAAYIKDLTTPTPHGSPLFSPPDAFAYLRMPVPRQGTFDCFAADVWAMGVLTMFVTMPRTMYTLLEQGNPAIMADIRARRVPLALRVVIGEVKARARDERSPLFSKALADVLDRALDDDPQRRASMEELAGLLAAAAHEETQARVREAAAGLVQSGALPEALDADAPTARDGLWWAADVLLANETLRQLEPFSQVRCAQSNSCSVLLIELCYS